MRWHFEGVSSQSVEALSVSVVVHLMKT